MASMPDTITAEWGVSGGSAGIGFRIACGALLGVLGLALPVVAIQLFDRVLTTGQLAPVVMIGGAAVIATGLALIVQTALDRVMETDRQTAGGADLLARLNTPGIVLGQLPIRGDLPTAPAAGSFAVLVAMLSVQVLGAAFLTGILAAVSIVFACLAFIGAAVLGRQPAPDDPRAEHAPVVPAPLIGAALGSLWTIKILGAELPIIRRIEAEAAARAAANPAPGLTRYASLRTLMSRLAFIAGVTVGSVLTIYQVVTIGQMVAGTVLAVMIVDLAFRAGDGWRHRVTAPPRATPAVDATLPPLPLITGNVLVNGVTHETPPYTRGGISRFHFDTLTLSIDHGECIRVVSEDRHRISAFLRLVAGLDQPITGQVLIDGHVLRDHRVDSFARQIAYVPSAAAIWPGTVLENLSALDPERRADAAGAARLLGLDRALAHLPDGLDSSLPASAAGYPAGFRQHLGLARAMAAKPKILLLDFATEDLDSRDFRHVTDVLGRLKGRVTVIFASTQIGMTSLADREIDLDDPSKTVNGPERAGETPGDRASDEASGNSANRGEED